ncbi:MAG: adenylosuccinate lyase [Spirochaetales bacterium]|nr:adenylosuccinate lyase [Spirochaetales bacterium]
MEKKNIFLNLSPLDHRYYLSNREVHEALGTYLSEEAAVRYCLKVEIALLKALIPYAQNLDADGKKLSSGLDKLSDTIDPEEVYKEEAKTQHNIRALVNVLKTKVPAQIKHLVHVGATSVDILDTAFSLRIKHAVRRVLLPLLLDLETELVRLCKQEAETIQVGRTHGQHAVPLTFGYAVAEYVSRLGKSIERIELKSRNLKGKLAGAVGAYNAASMITADPEKLEAAVLSSLGLEPSEHSTQLVEPEYVLELMLEINTAFGIIANLADDLRHLQRSELAEVREHFSKRQVGSSTMPQKRNPWNSEHVKSLWKAFMPRVITMFMDQISEHQRDLSNSASQRFIVDFIAGFSFAVKRMIKICSGLAVDRERMKQNLSGAGDTVLAEAAYILLAMGGEADAHEVIRRVTLECEKTEKSLVQVLKNDGKTWNTISLQLKKVMNADPENFFSHPELYQGVAAKKAKKIAEKYEQKIKQLQEALG